MNIHLQAREDVQKHVCQPTQDMWLINMCLEHEKMHQETLCYMLAQQQKQFWESSHLDSTGNLIVQNGISCPEPLARVSPLLHSAKFLIAAYIALHCIIIHQGRKAFAFLARRRYEVNS